MRTRSVVPDMDIDGVVELNCDPDLDLEQQAEARKLLHAVFGPYTEAVLRACGRAAAQSREVNNLRERLGQGAGPQLRGIVTGVRNGRIRLLLGGTERLLDRPDGVTLGIGQMALTDGDGRRVIGADDFLVGGHTFAFCERLDGRYALVRPLREGPEADARQLALVADCVDVDALAPDDRVLGWSIDYGNLVLITRRLDPLRPPAADDVGVGRTVTRADVVGLDEIIEEAELLFLAPESPAYAAMLARARRALVGLVFHGPTGCGKSTVAELFVSAVRARGGQALYRTASHYLSKWVGDGAAKLRADFARLDAAFAETRVRPLLVIDELEAIALDRSHPAALNGGYLDVLDTLLSLLTRTEARMIGISNVANRYLETALVRDGRLRIVPFPATLEPEQVTTLVAKCLDGVPLAPEEA